MMVSNSTCKLIGLLDEEAILSSQYTGGYSNRFICAGEFHHVLVQPVSRINANDFSAIDELILLFAPTCSWDDFIGLDGLELGNLIFDILQKFTDIHFGNGYLITGKQLI